MIFISVVMSLFILVSSQDDDNNDFIAEFKEQRGMMFNGIKGCEEGSRGQCLSRKQCVSRGGSTTEGCFPFGICCIVEPKCEDTVSNRVSYFKSPENYNQSQCSLQIRPFNRRVCQLKLDFEQFSLSQPRSVGDEAYACQDDEFLVTTNGNNNLRKRIPPLCGENSGQHLYVWVNPSSISSVVATLTVSSFRSTTRNVSRVEPRWRVKITQIECEAGETQSRRLLMNRLGLGELEAVQFNDRSGLFGLFNKPNKESSGGLGLPGFFNNRKGQTSLVNDEGESPRGLLFQRPIFHKQDTGTPGTTRNVVEKAPPGCDQYFTSSEGTIESFNYNGGNGPYVGGLSYAICFKRSTYCGIRLRAESFQLGYNRNDAGTDRDCDTLTDTSTTTTTTTTTSTETPSTSSTSTTSTTPSTPAANLVEDYIFIPDGRSDSGLRASKFCDAAIPTNNTDIFSVTPGPLYLYFNSGGNLSSDRSSHKGFRLRYTLMLC